MNEEIKCYNRDKVIDQHSEHIFLGMLGNDLKVEITVEMCLNGWTGMGHVGMNAMLR